ncbi:PREDICTED: F-box/kelch-repeat protein At5g51250-like [Camelina sativa]|uniref:F-box/kelch-repeat protein At5g51250-like n=1 Tax=Camelina sativa TaxID=90675 RepID=A0ABM1RBQ2_CAMSA|nr:PREDICTED: F-box/kelch-repeat protein At5g51250-like [Camelina sativa]
MEVLSLWWKWWWRLARGGGGRWPEMVTAGGSGRKVVGGVARDGRPAVMAGRWPEGGRRCGQKVAGRWPEVWPAVVARDGEEEDYATHKKQKQKQMLSSTPQSSLLNPSLPYDLLLHIVARVPRLYHPTLSLVSKSFRSLLASPELYKVRSQLGLTESCLYVCFDMLEGPTWFTLCRKSDQTNKEERSGYALARIPIPNSPYVQFSSLVSVGSDIYNIGAIQPGRFKASSSSVSILDCMSHTWREAPSLPVELLTVCAGVLDGKIYAAGQYKDDSSSDSFKNLVEVLDIKTQVWSHEHILCSIDPNYNYISNTACIDGKFNVAILGN